MWLCCGYLRGVLCYGNLRGVVMLWVFKACGYVLDILEVWLYYGYLKGVVML